MYPQELAVALSNNVLKASLQATAKQLLKLANVKKVKNQDQRLKQGM